jgi:radical SAM superfamily enzyme YgiQ (UPF0313 family)
MKILLVNPSLRRATTGQYEKEVETKRGLYPPLGLTYIAGVLEKNEHQVKIFDCDAEGGDAAAQILKICADWQPEMAGFYAMTWTYCQARQLAEQIKNYSGKIITVVGGPNVSCLPKESLEFGRFDFGVRGEGEETIIELVDSIRGKNNLALSQIKGLIFRKGREIIINEQRELIRNLDVIPFPSRHILLMEKYFDIFARQKKVATIIATRGCPFECIFCDRENRMGRNWRVRSPQNICAEIREVKEKYGIREFMFFDDNLIVDKQWGLELCRQLKPLNVIWECRNRVNLVDEEMLNAMKEAGCYRIRFGFESGDNGILKIMKKAITVEQSLRCAEICHRVNMEMFGYFMMGSPHETKETMQKTLDLALKIDPAFAVFSKTILIPGSELFVWAVENGQIDKNYWSRFLKGEETNGAPSFNTKELSEKEVAEFVSYSTMKFYMRLSYMIKRLLSIRSFTQLANQVKMGLALILN